MREMPTAFRLLTDRPGAGAGAEAGSWELEQNLGAVLATGTAGAASQPSLKCKRKIAWENFLNFSANI